MKFYVGLHQVNDAWHFERACLSINRLRTRKAKPVHCPAVLVDSGAFTELAQHHTYRHSVQEYAADLRRIAGLVTIEAAVAQDWMCEAHMLRLTGKTTQEHQRLTLERYDALMDCDPPCPIMPVLQGYHPHEYARHVEAYGERLEPGMWVGVGSVCKRNTDPEAICRVIDAIHGVRADLRLHGFGVKVTALMDPDIRDAFHSTDSMAWSFAARWEGRNANSWQEARRFAEKVAGVTGRTYPKQLVLGL